MGFQEWYEDHPLLFWILVGTGTVVLLVLIVVLVSLSFQYVEYNEYAVRKNTNTGIVDSSEVF